MKAEIKPISIPRYTAADITALQACVEGRATPEQQQRAMNWIIYQACGTYDFPFRPGDNDRETNIALGRMFAGQQILKLLKLNASAFVEPTE